MVCFARLARFALLGLLGLLDLLDLLALLDLLDLLRLLDLLGLLNLLARFLKNTLTCRDFSILSNFEENLIGKKRSNMRILEVEHDFFKTHVPAVSLKTFCQRPNFARILNP